MIHNDPRAIINREPMSGFQIFAVFICMALNALDGFDVLAITFAAPGISREWALGPGALGIVISTGLFGMAVGSLVIAPLADRFGRRPVILGCLIGMASGMLLSATAHNVYALAGWRVITGLGIGGMLAAVNSMVSEYANAQHRDLCVSLNTVGYPIGGVLGGLMAAWLLAHYEWRAVFIFGGVVTAIFLPVIWLRLPESIDFLAGQGRPQALQRINVILARMKHRPAIELPAPSEQAGGNPVLSIFTGELLPRTLMISGAYFLHIMTFYYILGWIPSIVAALGFTPAVGASVSVLTNLGGVVGGLAVGYFSRYFSLKYLAMGVMLGTAVMLAVFGRTEPELNSLKAVAFVLGFFMLGGVASLYAALVRVYPVHTRATGTGFIIGLGRVGGILGPTIGGWLMAAGVNRPDIAAIMALGSTLAAVFFMLMRGALLAAPGRSTAAN